MIKMYISHFILKVCISVTMSLIQEQLHIFDYQIQDTLHYLRYLNTVNLNTAINTVS